MKRIVASIGAAAIGSTAIQQVQAVNLSPQESTKPWSVAVALRGFYDDNYLQRPRSSSDIPESFGFEVRPTVGLNIPLEQTYFGLDLTYSGQYYDDDSHWDQSFLGNMLLNHMFSQRVTLDVQDRLVYSDRPELTDPNFSTVARTDQNNLHNLGNIQLSLGVSPRLGVVLGYENSYWDYANDDPAAENSPIPAVVNGPSLSALLNRIDQRIPINLRHQTGPATVTFIGYTFGVSDRTSDEFLGVDPVTGQGQKADIRNNRSHYGYVGVEHNFNPLLSLGVRGGVQYTEYYNDPLSSDYLTPYGDISVTYFYTTASSVELGYTLYQAATDVYAPDPTTGQVTQNRLAGSLYARADHQFMPNFRGSIFGQWQLAQYNGGQYDGQDDNFYLFGASLTYDINRFLEANLGYKFDYLDSEIPNRGFTRNRVYVGLTATY